MNLDDITYEQVERLLKTSEFSHLLKDFVAEEVRKIYEQEAQESYVVLAARENDHLIEPICWELGKTPIDVKWQYHADKTFTCEIMQNVRDKHCYVLLNIGDKPKEDIEKFTELIDALSRARANEIIGVIPELPGQRQDKRHGRRQAITVAKYARMFCSIGLDHVIAIEPHAPQIEALYKSFDPLSIGPMVHDYVKNTCGMTNEEQKDQIVIVSPDAGGMRSAEFVAKHFNYENPQYTFVKKARTGVNESKTGEVIGNVEGKVIILYDDIWDTGGTLIGGADACKHAGARKIYGAVAHALANNKLDFDPSKDKDIMEKIVESSIDELIITNTRTRIYDIITGKNEFYPKNTIDGLSSKVTVLSVAKYLAQAIHRDRYGGTIREMVKSCGAENLYEILHRAGQNKQYSS